MAVVGGTADVHARLRRVAQSLRASIALFPTVEEAIEHSPNWVLYIPNGEPQVIDRRDRERFFPLVALLPEPTDELPDADEVFLLDDLGVRVVSRLRTLRRTAGLLEEAVSSAGSNGRDLQTMRRLAAAAESVEDRTGGHPLRVAALSRALALKLGMGEREADVVSASSLLHDLGKARIPSSLLCKPSKLNSEEYAIVQRHTEFGAAWLEGSENELVRRSGVVARSHHERWDGNGYPDGLLGEQIPIESRVAAVADVFDALTSDRSYKPAWKPEQALREIEAGSGTQFDPNVVRALLSLADARLR
ncbi:MAG: hypothetical protein KatS3mg015_2082 [Fimbriimonadales bacterium]|nr:MAG: hypothetical protein KatS3mg015_2082 [Fimbriimonadales bacterium]